MCDKQKIRSLKNKIYRLKKQIEILEKLLADEVRSKKAIARRLNAACGEDHFADLVED